MSRKLTGCTFPISMAANVMAGIHDKSPTHLSVI